MNQLIVIMNEHGAPEVLSDTDTPIQVVLLEASALSTFDVSLGDMEYMATSTESRFDPNAVRSVLEQYSGSSEPVETIVQSNVLTGLYTSRWDEGDVTSYCSVNLPDLSIDVDVSDQGAEFEHHRYDCVTLTINGKETTLRVEEIERTDTIEFTEESRELLCALLLDEPLFSPWHKALKGIVVCPHCGADLSLTDSVVREYLNKDSGSEDGGFDDVLAYGHYKNGQFKSDSFDGFDGGRYDLHDDSDKCTSCDGQL